MGKHGSYKAGTIVRFYHWVPFYKLNSEVLHTSFHNLDLDKYKRVFTLGCSFTRYAWSSWADMLSMTMPHAEYHNQGVTGAGQMYIQTILSQLNTVYNFCETDLVVVMWSTFCRLDLYLYCPREKKHAWVLPGNIFSQAEYPEEMNPRWTPQGFLMRDLAIIQNTHNWVQHEEFDFVSLLGQHPSTIMDFVYREIPDMCNHETQNVIDFYQDLISVFDPEKAYWQPDTRDDYVYYISAGDIDYHPPIDFCMKYVQMMGVDLNKDISEKLKHEHECLMAGAIATYHLREKWMDKTDKDLFTKTIIP